MAAGHYTSPSAEGEVGEQGEPGGGAVGHCSTTPSSTSLREATSPSEEGEG